jgi:hypothetical protein
MGARGERLPKAQVAKMMRSARQTMADARTAEIEGYRRRDSDPLERAKLALQRAGIAAFSHSLHVPGSTLIVVGQSVMTAEQMIAHAERFGRW